MIPALGSASAGAATGSEKLPSSCASVACSTRSGTAALTSCVVLSRSFAAPPFSSAAASQLMLKASAGTSTGQETSCAAPAASVSSCGGRFSGVRRISPVPLFTVPESDARRFMVRAVVLRSVSIATKRSPSRTSGGRPESTCRSCVTRMLVAPLPKRCAPSSAMATRRKLVSESFSGTSTTASPLASSTTRSFHTSSVSNSSRVPPLPPPPPAATALRP